MATDQEIRDQGLKYIPEQQYLKYPFELPQDQEPVTNLGIVNTNAFMNSSGMDSGGNFNNIYGSGYDETIGAPGASPFLNMSQSDFNKQMFETGPFSDPYGQKLTDYNRNPMIDPLNQKIVDKLRADMDAAYPSEGTADLIAKYREYNPNYNRYTDEEITQLGLKGFKPNYTDEELIDMYGNQNFKGGMFEDEEDEKFNFMDYIPFVGDKSIMQGILKALPQNDPRATSIRDYYGGQGNLTSTGSIASGLMTGYNPVSGGFLNTITGGRFGSPTKYGLQRAYEKRINTIQDTLKRKDSQVLRDRLDKLREEKAAELNSLQQAQSRKDYNTIQDAYQNQTGQDSGYSGSYDPSDDTSYSDPFDPGGGE